MKLSAFIFVLFSIMLSGCYSSQVQVLIVNRTGYEIDQLVVVLGDNEIKKGALVLDGRYGVYPVVLSGVKTVSVSYVDHNGEKVMRTIVPGADISMRRDVVVSIEMDRSIIENQ